jgi:hypothetical protein
MSRLPAGFEALEAFVDRWALNGTAKRAAQRGETSANERQAFFGAITPRLSDALALLDAKPLSDHDEADRNLLNLCLSLAHVAQAVEMQGDDEDKHTPSRNAMLITRSVADVDPA